MITQFQDSNWIKEEAIKLLQKNKNRRVSAMFRELRKKPYFSLFGDYIIFAEITRAYKELKLPIKKEHFNYAFKFSKEMKYFGRGERKELLAQITGNRKDLRY